MSRSGLLVLTICSCGFAIVAMAQPPLQYAREDPTKIRTFEACGECHVSEAEVWKKTPHATGFKTLHRKASAEAIRGRMGYKLIKRDSECLLCHYTPTLQGGQLRAFSGVSCESCHGAGADWIDIHNEYGGKGFDHNNETPEHRAARIAQSRAAGMRRASDLYELASSCYGCHTVPDERLVNVGRHSIGSAGFELVEWSQGQIRHNFLDSLKNGDGTVNAERPPERKRLMYVVGRVLELEHGLRGAAGATAKGLYFKAMQRRIRTALSEVRAIAANASLPEIDRIVAIVRGVDIKLDNKAALEAAAEQIGEAARGFLARRDGTRLANLDPLVDGTYDGADFDDPPAAGTIETADVPSTDPGSAETPAVLATGAPAAVDPAPVVRRTAIPAVGEKKTRILPRSRHATISAIACQECHGDENAWWGGDPHSSAIEPFLNRLPKNVKIARFYGIDPRRMFRGDSLCMDCHGTIVSGEERDEVYDGVSCQSCHGAAKDFLEPHREGATSLGVRRPGYVEGLRLGMVELRNLDTRARVCTGCHYVTDPRLLSSGHPSGAGFDYAGGMRNIEHWQGPAPAAGALRAAFSSALEARGVVPEVRLARAAGPAEVASSTVSRSRKEAVADPSVRPEVPRDRPAERYPVIIKTGDAPSLNLPPFPEIDDATPVEEVLLLLKQRLEQLYQAVSGEP